MLDEEKRVAESDTLNMAVDSDTLQLEASVVVKESDRRKKIQELKQEDSIRSNKLRAQ